MTDSSPEARLHQTHLGRLLRLHRTVSDQTVRQFAPQIGISVATLSRIERGHAMDAATLMKVLIWLTR